MDSLISLPWFRSETNASMLSLPIQKIRYDREGAFHNDPVEVILDKIDFTDLVCFSPPFFAQDFSGTLLRDTEDCDRQGHLNGCSSEGFQL